MEPRKFSSRFSHLYSSLRRSSSAPSNLQTLPPDSPPKAEPKEEEQVSVLAQVEKEVVIDAAPTADMMTMTQLPAATVSAPALAPSTSPTEKSKRPSRLQRLSSFLSPIISRSESQKEARTLRKPAPALQPNPNFSKSAVQLGAAPTAAPLRPPPPPPKERSSSAHFPSKRQSQPERRRAESPNRLSKASPTSPQDVALAASGHSRHLSSEARGRRRIAGNSLSVDQPKVRAVSMTSGLRPKSATNSPEETKSTKRRISGFGLLRSNNSRDSSPSGKPPKYEAWMEDPEVGILKYALDDLLAGRKVPELFDMQGNVCVYLFPFSSGRGPSFRVRQTVFAASQELVYLLSSASRYGTGSAKSPVETVASDSGFDFGDLTLTNPETPPYTPQGPPIEGVDGSLRAYQDAGGDIHFHFPVDLIMGVAEADEFDSRDKQALLDVRNLFALLTGNLLVRSQARPSDFYVFLAIAELLRKFEFSNFSGETYGEGVEFAFTSLAELQGLADVRGNPRKIIQAIVLGEEMRSAELYSEAFAHAVGQFDDVSRHDAKLYSRISSITRKRLERAHLTLMQRQKAVRERLENFEFPSIFSGIANSTSSSESKYIKFKSWRASYNSMRRFVLAYYKELNGDWPPKARSKKNAFVEGGLNRLVLKSLYADLCHLYDTLVDRKTFTTRGMDASDDQDTSNLDNVNPTHATLRQLLGEYDRSSPPVQPPIPFDVPLIPTPESLNPRFPMLSPKEQYQKLSRKLPSHEYILILTKSHNQYPKKFSTPFVEAYKAFEEDEGQGKSCMDLSDQRIGHWIFLYAVIQSLPLLVTDAPGVRHTEGVEYFLCQPSLGNLPWLEDAGGIKKEWYGVSKTGGMVSMPADVVNHGVEAVYRRSHCWTIAKTWLTPTESSGGSTYVDEPSRIESSDGGLMSPLAPPPGFGSGDYDMGPHSPASPSSPAPAPASGNTLRVRHGRNTSRGEQQRLSMAIGLERLPMPPSIPGQENYGSRPGTPQSASGSGPASDWGQGNRRVSTMGRDSPTINTPSGPRFEDFLGGNAEPKKSGEKKSGGKKK